MSTYAVIAGVIFAWAVTLGWAALEVKDAHRKKRESDKYYETHVPIRF